MAGAATLAAGRWKETAGRGRTKQAAALSGWAAGAGDGLPGPWRRGELGTGRRPIKLRHVAAAVDSDVSSRTKKCPAARGEGGD